MDIQPLNNNWVIVDKNNNVKFQSVFAGHNQVRHFILTELEMSDDKFKREGYQCVEVNITFNPVNR